MLRLATVVAALGVVFGDIGTSPIYTLQTVFNPSDPHPVPLNSGNVFGVVSLVFWSVVIIVTVTYVLLAMRADNDGEGGIMALITLLRRLTIPGGRRVAVGLAVLGIFGAALFLGDSMITPAISVLSAVEGLKVVQPSLADWVVPITAAIIVVLFAVQRRGTAAVGRVFGPVMIAWFVAIGVTGVDGITRHPGILKALSPTYALGFLVHHFGIAFFALAAVVLAVTGAEALYADMGHFGRRSITLGWLWLVFPACVLSYFGQGALILADPTAVSSPFFLITPGWARLPMVLLATAATVIASQAVVTGAFSVTAQAARLGYLPRLRIAHTSAGDGRADLRAVDQLVAGGLGPHPGLRVPQLRRPGVRLRDGGHRHDHHHHADLLLHRPRPVADPAVAARARRHRAADRRRAVPGGEPDQVRARRLAAAADRAHRVHRHDDLAAGTRDRHRKPHPAARARCASSSPRCATGPIAADRVAGTAVFLNRGKQTAPLALRANVETNHVRHEHVVIMSVETELTPRVPDAERIEVDDLGFADDGITHITARYGYTETPDVPAALRLLRPEQTEGEIDPDAANYFLSKIELRAGDQPTLARWRKRLFIATSHITADAADEFGLPRDRTLIVGSHIDV